MLKVSPIQIKEEQQQICEICKIDFEPDALAYRANIDDKLIGICQFSLKGGNGHLINLTPIPGIEDDEAMCIMGSAALSFMERCGIIDTYAEKNAASDKILQWLGFRTDEQGRYYLNLEEYFKSPCEYRHKS